MGLVPFLDFTMIQCNMAHVFLDYYVEAEDNIPQILKERAAADGNSETHECAFQRGWRPVCAAGLRTDKIRGTIGLGVGLYPGGEQGKCWVSWENRALSRSALSPTEVLPV